MDKGLYTFKYYYILEDLEKYGVNKDTLASLTKFSDNDFMVWCKKYYTDLLKIKSVDVTAWIRVFTPTDEYVYKSFVDNQTRFMRDSIFSYLFKNAFKNSSLKIINMHWCKSLNFPVFKIHIPNPEVDIVIRNNTYDWNISIDSAIPIVFDNHRLINDENYGYCFCQGMEKYKFEKYKDNNKRFTFAITHDYDVYAFMLLLSDYLMNLR